MAKDTGTDKKGQSSQKQKYVTRAQIQAAIPGLKRGSFHLLAARAGVAPEDRAIIDDRVRMLYLPNSIEKIREAWSKSKHRKTRKVNTNARLQR